MVKEPFLDHGSDMDHRMSFYGGGVPTGRDSMYDASSLDYRPVSHGNPGTQYAPSRSERLSSHGGHQPYGNSLEGRHSYGDLRRSVQVNVGVYEDFEERQVAQQGRREREREYAY
jgi:hypothetical protein